MSRSMDKALTVLDQVADGAETLASLAERTGYPKSTVHRLAGVLVDRGFLRLDDGRYHLGYRLMDLGERARQQVPLHTIARRHMERLAQATRETVHLGELVGEDIAYLDKVDGGRGLQMRSQVGLTTPAGLTAMGKAMIAFRPEREWPRFFYDGAPRTKNTITSLEAFEDELTEVRATGVAFDREENEEGICCIAAPIRDARGDAVAAISVSGAVIFMHGMRLHELADTVRSIAGTIAQELGAREGVT